MSKVIIANMANKTIHADSTSKSLLEHIHDAELDWMHACGGNGRCTSCKAIVLDGAEHFSPLSPFEEKCIDAGKLKEGERLSCQCQVNGDITIQVPETSKFPHITYTEV
ncbi:2Fe-2S iron-sulfur cluster-binding protein [Algivirga pacifica]|uniref:2Fe-2S ferredoxin-type domain-containing protein n=1 Tax=Algivirga pacifica TaxID=1162670 RepID=A0ABP9DAQ5_9BACT